MRRLSFSRRVAVLLAAALAPALGPAPAGAADAAISDQIVVRHRAGATLAERADARHDAGVSLDRRLDLTGVEVVLTGASRSGALAALRDDPDVLWAEPNQPVTAATNDPLWQYQYGLENSGSFGTADADVDIDAAWTVSRGAGITVGVVDTGVDGAHPDLAGQLVGGVNFVADGQTTATDGHGHGTHVAGIVAALSGNGIGVSGAAPLAKVQALRALDASGNGSTATVAAAFAYAGGAGLRVVNASLGSIAPTNVERQAIQAHPNTLFVVAAGNSSTDIDAGGATAYPCRYTYANVLCVGASTATDAVASFSNTGPTSVDLFAPGDLIASTYPGNRYVYMSGTSMASPLVAAAGALVAAEHPDWTAAQLKAALLSTVDYRAGLAGVSVTGGRLNAARALGVDVGPDGSPSTPPTPPTSPPATTPAATTPAAPEATKPPATPPPTTTTPPTTTPEPGQPTVVPPTPVPTPPATPPQQSGPGEGAQEITPLPDLSELGAPVEARPPEVRAVSHVARVRVALVRGKVRGVRFHLSAPGSVTITAARKKSSARGALTRTRTRALPAGPVYIPLDRSPSGMPVATGSWRLTVTGEAGQGSVRFIVR